MVGKWCDRDRDNAHGRGAKANKYDESLNVVGRKGAGVVMGMSLGVDGVSDGRCVD